MGSPAKSTSVVRTRLSPNHAQQGPAVSADSGYYGSQSQDAVRDLGDMMQETEAAQAPSPDPLSETPQQDYVPSSEMKDQEQPTLATQTVGENCQSGKEQQARTAGPSPAEPDTGEHMADAPAAPSSPVQLLGQNSPNPSPAKSTTLTAQAERNETVAADQDVINGAVPETEPLDDDGADVTRSPSDGSSPIRPLMRKSSLNFASLPAREPMTCNKSLGGRMSRTSHIEQTQTSYFPRQTGGKSIGVRQDDLEDDLEDDDDAMDVDDAPEFVGEKDSVFSAQGKSYTQRLQDQISMLGKSQITGARPSKSIPNLAGAQASFFAPQPQITQPAHAAAEIPQSPLKSQPSARTPGAFPEDDEDDWIAPPTTTKKLAFNHSPRPGLGKTHSADATETVDGFGLDMRQDDVEVTKSEPALDSPKKLPVFHQGYQITSHGKSVSVPDVRHNIFGRMPGEDAIRRGVSASNPVLEIDQDASVAEAPRSPSKTVRESPVKHNSLKQVKDKFSSILKGSKGLLVSSAVLSAETKASLRNSPSVAKMHSQPTKSAESLALEKQEQPLYPDLSKHVSSESHPEADTASPGEVVSRKTRASSERDRRDQKQKQREDKQVQHLAEQMEKLEKARELEREKARIFSQEKQDRLAVEKQVVAQKEQERNTRTPAPKDAPKPTRTSPRKAQAPAETVEDEAADQDLALADAPITKPPPSIPRPTVTPGQMMKTREIKRPMKPTREAAVKPKQAPTLIRVNTSSQHGGFHPSNSTLSSNLHDTLSSSQHAKGKTLQTKASVQSLTSSINSTTGRPKALELADKRRQEEEKKAQRKRELKAEMERKREEVRRQDEERREKDRQRVAAEEEARKAAARQAAIERAKHTKAPPPAPRSQPIGPSGNNNVREKAPISRPPSRLGQSTMHRSQEDVGRPVNAILSTASKMPVKRPLQQDGAEGARGGQTQQKDAKRMRMSDEFDPEEELDIQSYGTNLKGPPVRPSAGLKKVSHYSRVIFSWSSILTYDSGSTKQVSVH